MARPLKQPRYVEEDRGYVTRCWIWQLSTDKNGYGVVKIGGRNGRLRRAHRIAYEEAFGEIPDELDIHHLCNIPGCVRPTHLEAITRLKHRRHSRILPDEVYEQIICSDERQSDLARRMGVSTATVSTIKRTVEVMRRMHHGSS